MADEARSVQEMKSGARHDEAEAEADGRVEFDGAMQKTRQPPGAPAEGREAEEEDGRGG